MNDIEINKKNVKGMFSERQIEIKEKKILRGAQNLQVTQTEFGDREGGREKTVKEVGQAKKKNREKLNRRTQAYTQQFKTNAVFF